MDSAAEGGAKQRLGGRDSNPDSQDQNLMSCRWTTPQRDFIVRHHDRREPARHTPRACARLGGGAAGGGDAEHAHRLQAEAELLAAVAGADVQAGELAHALEAVVDRVAVGEQALRGAGDVAVGVEERLDRRTSSVSYCSS